MAGIPEALLEQKSKIICDEEAPKFVSSLSSLSTFSSLGVEQQLTQEDIDQMRIRVLKSTSEELVLDIVGVDLSIVNALRRILISEIPTIAIELVDVYNNTSVIPDEVLCHRLGLIPLKVDPSTLEYKKPTDPETDRNTLLLSMDVTCTRKPKTPTDLVPSKKYLHSSVYSGDIHWTPMSDDQKARFADAPPAPVDDNILIAKLRPPQTIHVTCHCVKGIGKMHAKFSPVATASYRLLPEITFKQPIMGSAAKALKRACPLNVFDIEEATGSLFVARPRNCSVCRECLRSKWRDELTDESEKKQLENVVALARVKNYTIFSVESTGILPAATLMTQAFDVFLAKLDTLTTALNSSSSSSSPSSAF